MSYEIMVFSRTAGYRHESIPDGIAAIREIGQGVGLGAPDGWPVGLGAWPGAGVGAGADRRGAPWDDGDTFTVEATEDAAAFTPDNLARFAAVVFLNTSGDVFEPEQREAFAGYLAAGGGFVGVHQAADTETTWPFYGRLVGAWFVQHPEIQPATVIIEDRDHPATAHLDATWTRTDEWYNFHANPRPGVQVLASLDETSYTGGTMAGDHPIAWCHEYGGARAFYTAMGHTAESYADPAFRRHLLGGIRWAADAL